MDILRFSLGGKTAFFKKPDVNTHLYFTYGNIHKVALIGLVGAVMGYGGYNQMSFKKKYEKLFPKGEKFQTVLPEFYEKLKDLKVGITPLKNSFSKKVQTYNNSVGYASQEQGGNLIIKEQWIEEPEWIIYIGIESDEEYKIVDSFLKQNFIFMPYLGKNDHPADIKDVRVYKDVETITGEVVIDSLFMDKDFEEVKEDNVMAAFDFADDEECNFKYQEKLPIALEEETNRYLFEKLIYTNSKVKTVNNTAIINIDGKNIVLF